MYRDIKTTLVWYSLIFLYLKLEDQSKARHRRRLQFGASLLPTLEAPRSVNSFFRRCV